jgi:mono/diheme cytochrome c family protein
MSWACSERGETASVAAATLGAIDGPGAARARGKQIYLAHCVPCHGASADGLGVEGRGLARQPASFRSARFREPGARVRVEAALRDGVAGTAMPGWRHLGPDSLRDLAEYVLSVSEQGP